MTKSEKLAGWLLSGVIAGVVALYIVLNWDSAIPPAREIVKSLFN